jgi:hypothetical protein
MREGGFVKAEVGYATMSSEGLTRPQRRQLIVAGTEMITKMVNNGEPFIIISISDEGPNIVGPVSEEVTLWILRVVTEAVDWNKLPDPDADWLRAIGRLQ